MTDDLLHIVTSSVFLFATVPARTLKTTIPSMYHFEPWLGVSFSGAHEKSMQAIQSLDS